jgi:cell wall-associated NlpC family hydrolase
MTGHTRKRGSSGGVAIAVAALIAGIIAAGIGVALLALLIGAVSPDTNTGCGSASAITLGPPGTGQLVGATEYGGPGDPSSGVVGASGANLLSHPDSYAELGGETFQTATAIGGLPYLTPLRITWDGRSAIAYKRDFGLGGAPIGGLPRAIDLWWLLAERLRIPYDSGRWSGPVRIERVTPPGAAAIVGNVPEDPEASNPAEMAAQEPTACAPTSLAGVPTTPGERARLLPNGLAAAPAGAPRAIAEIIAAGNQIVGKPYVYGAGHGLALSAIAPAYDCSSSVEHLLYGARLVPVTDGAASSVLESFGAAGPGRWVTLYASSSHVFMYVAGLRWDTHDAAGRGDGSTGIGWHPLVRSADGFVARHPVGL